jgi:2-keto-4-pentenoate hydratase/2-oxohepta-3-ene-1,7-dioic acid hydratase in catechol pathway
MHLAMANTADGRRPVAVSSTAVSPIAWDGSLTSLIRAGRSPRLLALGDPMGLDEMRLLSPIRPPKIVAIGLNYRDHVIESGVGEPTAPLIFAKFPTSIIGPGDSIVLNPSVAERVDWEVELAVVVGHTMRNVTEAQALDYVFGYTVANDVSARDVQFGDVQWVRGKSLDSFCPVGPVIVTADEIPDPQNLPLVTRVNGEIMQSSSTAEMIFGVAEILAYCSRSFTLEPGDLVLTGTPWGCGEFMSPKRSLKAGDVVEVGILGIGQLSNPVTELAVA